MATIPTPEQGKPILDFSAGTFDGSSNLFQSRNGATEHVNGDDVADYVNTSRIYNGLNTVSKTLVGAINEVNRKDASDITYDNTESVADKLDSLSAVSRFTATDSIYGKYSIQAINGIKCVRVIAPKGLTANATTTLDFTLPKTMRPLEESCYFDIRQPNDNYTIRLSLHPDGTVQIYNYGTNTGTLNMSYTGCYI